MSLPQDALPAELHACRGRSVPESNWEDRRAERSLEIRVIRKHTCPVGLGSLTVSARQRISFAFDDTASVEHQLHPDSKRDGSESHDHNEEELDHRQGSGYFIFEKHCDGPFC
jgi:hypothetical protein